MLPNQTNLLDEKVASVLNDFTEWLARYGETSRDHQTFFAGATGRAAKALYYRHKLLGTAAVAPMIFFEAFLPSARRLFHQQTRFPIADAHYAMGFAFLFQVTNDEAYWQRAIHFLNELKKSRSPGFTEYCWGYVWTRPGLPKKTRSMLNLAMLAALNRGPELKLHVNGALNNGLSKEEIKEIFLQVAIYCGIPAGLDAFKTARDVFKERGV
jgi:alkylhydroperoxidase/carboxymuconolactone decarboxylase family protein YurZ